MPFNPRRSPFFIPVFWLAGLPVIAGAFHLAPAHAADAAPRAVASPGPADGRERVVFEQRSQWNRVLVADKDGQRSLYFGGTDGDTQSTISLRDPAAVPMEYVRHAASALAFSPRRSSALVVGLGGATYPMLLRRALPAMVIDVVELDPLVRQVARRYFGLVEDAKLRVHITDGARFVEQARQRWDLILLDAYGAAGIPAPLASDAFFAAVARRLAPGGIAVANITDTSPDRERALMARFAKAFPACVLQHTPTSDNVILVAGSALPEDIPAALRALDGEHRLPFAVGPMAPLYRPCTGSPSPAAGALPALPDVPGFTADDEETGSPYRRRTYARRGESITVTLAHFPMSEPQYREWVRMSSDFPQASLAVGPAEGNGFYQCAPNDPARCNLLIQLRCGLHLEIRGPQTARRQDADAILRELALGTLAKSCASP